MRSPSATSPSTPAVVRCLLTDREQLTSYLHFRVEHYRRIRHSNFIKLTFGETRSRVKVIDRLPGEAQLPVAGLPLGPSQPRLARHNYDPRWATAAAQPTPPTPSTRPPDAQQPETVPAIA